MLNAAMSARLIFEASGSTICATFSASDISRTSACALRWHSAVGHGAPGNRSGGAATVGGGVVASAQALTPRASEASPTAAVCEIEPGFPLTFRLYSEQRLR
jgi:hypothetical protein